MVDNFVVFLNCIHTHKKNKQTIFIMSNSISLSVKKICLKMVPPTFLPYWYKEMIFFISIYFSIVLIYLFIYFFGVNFLKFLKK